MQLVHFYFPWLQTSLEYCFLTFPSKLIIHISSSVRKPITIILCSSGISIASRLSCKSFENQRDRRIANDNEAPQDGLNVKISINQFSLKPEQEKGRKEPAWGLDRGLYTVEFKSKLEWNGWEKNGETDDVVDQLSFEVRVRQRLLAIHGTTKGSEWSNCLRLLGVEK